MEWTDEMIKQCPKPEGEFGWFVAGEMNNAHYGLWKWGLGQITIPDNSTILDVGCGGGGAIQLLNKLNATSKIYGIDISEDMVSMSQEVNKELVKQGLVDISYGSVSSVPFPTGVFDLVTALETTYFWPEIKKDLKEIYRVLKEGGTFILINECYTNEKFDEVNAEQARIVEMNFHSPEEFTELLTKAGFTSINITEITAENWITVTSKKPGE